MYGFRSHNTTRNVRVNCIIREGTLEIGPHSKLIDLVYVSLNLPLMTQSVQQIQRPIFNIGLLYTNKDGIIIVIQSEHQKQYQTKNTPTPTKRSQLKPPTKKPAPQINAHQLSPK